MSVFRFVHCSVIIKDCRRRVVRVGVHAYGPKPIAIPRLDEEWTYTQAPARPKILFTVDGVW